MTHENLSILVKCYHHTYAVCNDLLYSASKFHLHQEGDSQELQRTILLWHFSLITSLVVHYASRNRMTFCPDGETFRQSELQGTLSRPWDTENDQFLRNTNCEVQAPRAVENWTQTCTTLAAMPDSRHCESLFDFRSSRNVQSETRWMCLQHSE